MSSLSNLETGYDHRNEAEKLGGHTHASKDRTIPEYEIYMNRQCTRS